MLQCGYRKSYVGDTHIFPSRPRLSLIFDHTCKSNEGLLAWPQRNFLTALVLANKQKLGNHT